MFYRTKDLKKLIKSMSMAEKRYFSLSSSTFIKAGKLPFYLQLFQALSGAKDELPDFPEESSSQIYTTVKKRLFKNILKSLRHFHQEKSVEIRIQNDLSEIEILYSRGLPEQSLFLFDDAYKLAVTHEKFSLLLQILEWEHKLNMVLNVPTRTVEVIAAEEQEVLQKLLQVMHLGNIYSKAKSLKKQYGYLNEKMKEEIERETIKAPGMVTLEACRSQKAKLYFNFIHALYYFMTFNHQKAYQYSRHLLRPEFRVILPDEYVHSILKHVTSCVGIGAFDEALDGLQQAANYIRKDRLNKSHSLNRKLLYYQTTYHLIIYNYMGAKRLLAETVRKTEENLGRYDEELNAEMKQVIYANLMNACLGLGNLKMVDLIWEKLFNKVSKVRNDIYDDLYLFRIFNLLQSEVYAVLPSVVQSAHRYYKQSKKHPKHFCLELKITGLLLKKHRLEEVQIKEAVLKEIKQIILHYIASLEGTTDFQEHYTLYIIWMESILQGQPFYKAAAAWYQAYMAQQHSN